MGRGSSVMIHYQIRDPFAAFIEQTQELVHR